MHVFFICRLSWGRFLIISTWTELFDSKENICICFYTNINILGFFFVISKLSSVHKHNSWIQQNLWFSFTLFTLLVLLEFAGISKSGTLESPSHMHWGLLCDSGECQLLNQGKPVLLMWPKGSFDPGNCSCHGFFLSWSHLLNKIDTTAQS